ncbi:MAG: cell division protein FtsA [Candidatus Ryanbacteria bacterium]|nr:cell division protein FtsA [Candidatus Ryanbacteria bacterium]
MAQREYFAGLDIGSSTVRVVALEKRESEALFVAGVGEAEAQGVRKGAVITPEQAARSIQKALADLRKTSSIDLDHATVSLTDHRLATHVSKGAVSISRADGEVTKDDISRVIDASEAALPRMSNRGIIHSFPLFYTVDSDTHIREALGLTGVKLEVETLFIAGFSMHIKNLFKAVEAAGISIDDIVVTPYAASFQALSKKQKEVGSLLLDIGSQTSSLAVFEEGSLVSLDVIPYGSGHITYDIGLGFEIDLASAERVKRNLGIFLEQGKKEIRLSDFPKNFEETFSPKRLREIVSARLGDIFELVEKHLRRIGRAELLPGGVILTGGGAKLFDIGSSAREELHLPVEIGPGVLGLSGKKELVSGPEWATPLGLARYALEQHTPESRLSSLFSSAFGKRISRWLRALIP